MTGLGRLGGVTNVYGHQRLITPPVVNRMIIIAFVMRLSSSNVIIHNNVKI